MSEASSPSLVGTAASLILVLALFVGAAWLAKRSRPSGSNGVTHLATVASLSLGPRERVVIVEAAGQWLVLGVASGSVQPLATLPKPEGGPVATANAIPSAFAQVLARFGTPHGK